MEGKGYPRTATIRQYLSNLDMALKHLVRWIGHSSTTSSRDTWIQGQARAALQGLKG